MTVLVIAEHNNKRLYKSTLETISAASQLGLEITVLVAGFQCESVAKKASMVVGVKKVLLIDAIQYANFLAENLSQSIVNIANDHTHILAPSTSFGKNIMPRVAALLDVSQLSDIIKIDSDDTFLRSIYAGRAVAKVRSEDKIKVITVRNSLFEPALKRDQEGTIKPIDKVFENTLAKFVNLENNSSKRTIVGSERIIVSGGRGLENAGNFKLLEELANRLHGIIGASRAAVDAGFISSQHQIGQTGKTVAPDLYIAVGISGAIQHIAGMRESKVIVAINKDKDAPIFDIADYGIVGDLFEVVPELIAELS